MMNEHDLKIIEETKELKFYMVISWNKMGGEPIFGVPSSNKTTAMSYMPKDCINKLYSFTIDRTNEN